MRGDAIRWDAWIAVLNLWEETLSFADGNGIAELCFALPESLSLQQWI